MKSRVVTNKYISAFICYVLIVYFLISSNIFANAGYSVEQLQSALMLEDGSVNTETDAWKIWSILRSNGISEAAAAGIMGNLNQESQFSPFASNGSHTGIAQWDNSGRYANLQKWCQSNGKNAETVEAQAEFLIYEAPSRFNSNFTWEQYKTLDDVEGAAEAFCVFFEGCTSSSGETVKSAIMQAYWGTDYYRHTYQELSIRRNTSAKIYELYTGKDVTYYNPVSGYSDSSSSDSTSQLRNSGSLMSLYDLGVDVNDWHDTSIDLPTKKDLYNDGFWNGFTEDMKIRTWKEDVDEWRSSKVISWLRAVVAFIGIIIVVYSSFLYIAYWFDRINNFIDISMLSILTLGRLAISPDDTTSTFNPETKGIKVVTHRNMIFICLLGIAFGIVLLTGKIYDFIAWILSFVQKYIQH